MTSISALVWSFGVVAVFSALIALQVIWLGDAAQRNRAALETTSGLIGGEDETDMFFTLVTKGQLTRHAACVRPPQVASKGQRSAHVGKWRSKQSPSGRDLAFLPTETFKKDLNSLFD